MNKLICTKCFTSYELDESRWKCNCGNVLDIDFKPLIDPLKIKNRKPCLWRYREAIPIDDDKNIVSFEEGFTPLIQTEIEGKKVNIKFEQLFPTGSFKDRGASILISKIKELGIKKIVEDSSGNAGAAIAAYSAKAGIECHIYVPEKTSKSKLHQIELSGAILHKIQGNREDTANAVLEAAETSFYASHSWNPFFFQGTKTFSYEIWEQLGYNIPDSIIVPTGNGTLLIGAYIGFKDLLELGLIKFLPKFIAVQSENCAPLFKMFKESLSVIPEFISGETIAEGIAIARPVRANQIINIIKETNGDIITVNEAEIQSSLIEAGKTGIYLEPTSATAFAGLKKIKCSEKNIVILPVTGHGLKHGG